MSEPTRNVVQSTTNSATERLRALLDERGVEHEDAEDGHTQHTWWSDGDHEICVSTSGMRLAVYNVTPEQAIAATLGPGTCHVECFDDGVDEGLDGETFEVSGIFYGAHEVMVDSVRFDYDPGEIIHHHVPTVEDVLREMLDAWGELPSNATNEAIIAEYATKLRLAGDE